MSEKAASEKDVAVNDKKSESDKLESPRHSGADEKLKGVVKDLLEKDPKQLELHKKLNLCQDIKATNSLALHIKKVFGVLIDSYPSCALEKLEEVSYLIKNGEDLSKFLVLEECKDYRA